MKLYADEIEILSEKQQVKKAIEEKFGTLEKCSECMNNYPTPGSIRTYLRGATTIPEKIQEQIKRSYGSWI